MTIDPRVGFYFSIALAGLGFLSGAGATLTDLFGADHARMVLGITTLLLGFGNAVNAVLHAIPSKQNADKEFYLGPKEPPKA